MAVTEKDFVWITLTPEQIAFADRWAHVRQGNAEGADLNGHNNAPNDHDAALAMHVVGLRGEFPVVIHCKPVVWSYKAGVDAVGNRIADVEDFVDVKTRTKDWHSLIVQRDDPAHWAYPLVCASQHPRYCIVGFCWGHEAQQKEFWDDPAGGRAAYFIKRTNPIMKPIAELVVEIRKRQANQPSTGAK
jgi:hypothetical protein